MEIVEVIKALAQYPILALFVWWIWQSNKRWDENTKSWMETMEKEQSLWREYLKERNGKLETILNELKETIKRNKW